MIPVPSPLTAALAGAFSALVLPLASRWLGDGSDVSFQFVILFLVVVALPAHAFVLGFRRPAAPVAAVDKPLLVRVGAWIAAALLGSLASWAWM